MKTTTLLEAVGVDDAGRLFVRPASGHNYALIYRAGNGLRWSEKLAAVVAHQPEQWGHAELLNHVIATVESEYGESLVSNQATEWVNLSDEQRSALLKSVSA